MKTSLLMLLLFFSIEAFSKPPDYADFFLDYHKFTEFIWREFKQGIEISFRSKKFQHTKDGEIFVYERNNHLVGVIAVTQSISTDKTNRYLTFEIRDRLSQPVIAFDFLTIGSQLLEVSLKKMFRGDLPFLPPKNAVYHKYRLLYQRNEAVVSEFRKRINSDLSISISGDIRNESRKGIRFIEDSQNNMKYGRWVGLGLDFGVFVDQLGIKRTRHNGELFGDQVYIVSNQEVGINEFYGAYNGGFTGIVNSFSSGLASFGSFLWFLGDFEPPNDLPPVIILGFLP